MEYLILVILSPALLVGSLVFPIYWISQVRLLRRTGSSVLHRESREHWSKFVVRGIAVAYILCLGGIFLPGVFPKVRLFLESGWMLAVVLPLIADLAVMMACIPDRAVETWRAEHARR